MRTDFILPKKIADALHAQSEQAQNSITNKKYYEIVSLIPASILSICSLYFYRGPLHKAKATPFEIFSALSVNAFENIYFIKNTVDTILTLWTTGRKKDAAILMSSALLFYTPQLLITMLEAEAINAELIAGLIATGAAGVGLYGAGLESMQSMMQEMQYLAKQTYYFFMGKDATEQERDRLLELLKIAQQQLTFLPKEQLQSIFDRTAISVEQLVDQLSSAATDNAASFPQPLSRTHQNVITATSLPLQFTVSNFITLGFAGYWGATAVSATNDFYNNKLFGQLFALIFSIPQVALGIKAGSSTIANMIHSCIDAIRHCKFSNTITIGGTWGVLGFITSILLSGLFGSESGLVSKFLAQQNCNNQTLSLPYPDITDDMIDYAGRSFNIIFCQLALFGLLVNTFARLHWLANNSTAQTIRQYEITQKTLAGASAAVKHATKEDIAATATNDVIRVAPIDPADHEEQTLPADGRCARISKVVFDFFRSCGGNDRQTHQYAPLPREPF